MALICRVTADGTHMQRDGRWHSYAECNRVLIILLDEQKHIILIYLFYFISTYQLGERKGRSIHSLLLNDCDVDSNWCFVVVVCMQPIYLSLIRLPTTYSEVTPSTIYQGNISNYNIHLIKKIHTITIYDYFSKSIYKNHFHSLM